MGRESSPTHRAGETKLIQPFGIVIDDAASQHLPLPCICRNLEPLQLPKHFERAALSRDLRSWSNVLPLQQPLHELRRGYRLNLFA